MDNSWLGQGTRPAARYSSFQTTQRRPSSSRDYLKKALQQLQPLKEDERTNAGAIAQQQGNLLSQSLNARNQLEGGLRAQGMLNQSSALQDRLTQIDRGYNTQAMELAEHLKQREEDNQARQFQQDFQIRQADRGDFEADRSFGYGRERDTVMDRYRDAEMTGVLNGQQTLAAKQLAEAIMKRKMDDRIALSNLQGYDTVTGKPIFAREQFNTQTALQRASMAQRGGGGGGYSSVPSTVGERKQLATSTLLDAAMSRYDELRKAGYQYPLYYAVNTLMRDPKWVKAAQESGADIQSVIENLVRIKGKTSAQDYFSKGTGSKLGNMYNELAGKKVQNDWFLY